MIALGICQDHKLALKIFTWKRLGQQVLLLILAIVAIQLVGVDDQRFAWLCFIAAEIAGISARSMTHWCLRSVAPRDGKAPWRSLHNVIHWRRS